MKIRLIWGILLVCLGILIWQHPPTITAQAPVGAETLRVLAADSQGVVLELTVPDFQIETTTHQGESYQRVLIPDTVQTDTTGEPQVPVRGTLLGVPPAVELSVEVVEAEAETLTGYRLLPAPRNELIGQGAADPQSFGGMNEIFSLNQVLYNIDADYPGPLAEIGEGGHLRDQPVASVRLFPVQYNPVRGELRLYRRLVVKVSWTPSTSLQEAGPTRRASPTYEQVLRRTLLNYDHLDRSAASAEVPLYDGPESGSIGASAGSEKLKIGVAEDGMVQLTPTDLTGNGFNLTGGSLPNIKLENRGSEIPIFVHDSNSNNTFDSSDYILFYGTAITDVYTTKNIYWLEESGSPGLRMSSRDGTPSGGTPAPEFPITLHAEEDTEYWVTMPNGEGQDHWFWGAELLAPASRDYPLDLNHISNSAASTTVRIQLKGQTDVPEDPDHHTIIYLNGMVIDDQQWNGLSIYNPQVTVPHSYLNEGSNTIEVESVGDTGAIVDRIYVNWIEIDYWDTYVAENDALLFGAPSAGTYDFEVTNFSSDDIKVFDITDPSNVVHITTPAPSGNQVEFEDTAQSDSRYLALTPNAYKTPASLELDEPSNLKGPNNGHYIIITHRDFYTSAQTLAAHRSTTGVTAGKPVAVVKVEDIYDEFNDGIFNPQAIRDFLSHADNNWGGDPAYVLLLGGASYDYRDLLGLSRDNFVPTQIIETDLLGQTPSDNWFVTDDLLPYLFIGRLTPQDSAEAADMVDKTIYYELNPPLLPWKDDVLLVADDDSTVFETNSDMLAATLPVTYTANKVYVADYPPGDPTTDISSNIDIGRLLVNYSGHGNVDRWGGWSGGSIYLRSDVTNLNNTNRLPVVTVANCLNGFFVGQNTSMAEEFLLRADQGAVAVWAATSLDYPSGHRALMNEFYEAVFQEGKNTLGEATWQAKIDTYAQSSIWAELVETFVLFGDPAVEILVPTQSFPVFLPAVIKES